MSSPSSYSPYPPSSSSTAAPSLAVPSSQIPPSPTHSRGHSPASSDVSRPGAAFPSPQPPAVASTASLSWSAEPDDLSSDVLDGRHLSPQIGGLGQFSGGTRGVMRLEEARDILPPSYHDSRTISEPTTFTFSSNSFNSMVLLPPADAVDSTPVLHVSVAMNCFNPSSYVTTVRRGGSEMGEWIGEFEMGISAGTGMVTYGNSTKRIKSVLQKEGSKFSPTGTWTYDFSPQSPALVWRWNGNTMNCFYSPRGTFKPRQVAFFTGTPLNPVRTDERRLPRPKLKLWPEGYERNMIGHVVLSALIIERKRACPATKDTNHLFN